MGGHRRVKRTFHKGQELRLTIEDMAFGGKGIARVETEKGPFVVFVQNAFPGQVVDAQVAKCKARHAECRLLRVVEPADFEVDLPYQPIPGAPYATVPMEKQHEWKARTALDLYRKIGEVEDLDTLYQGFVPSPLDWHYRNKMEYSFSEIRHDLATDEKVDDFGLGFKHRGTWWAVENLDADSGLFDALVESTLHKVREWCEATGLPAWHPPKREGFFRFLVVRKSYANDGLLVNLVTTSDAPLDAEGFVECIRGLWGDRVKGILHTLNDDKGERVEAREGLSRVIWGDSTVTEVLHGLSFGISMGSFFQTNPTSAERLYAEVLALALEGVENRPQDVIMDLFCGTGTIGQLVAKHANTPVVGVDIVPSAIEDAREAAKRNGLTGVEFVAADAGKFLLENPEYQGKIHTVILDPPRAGISPKTLRKVMRLGAQRLVYVSCNPATQARDLVVLRAQGYALKSLKLVDQFPHTAHVEAVALIEKIPGFQPNLEA
ncbi:MAG: 23S rRNA (uracil(1939)-C(5))-methyltransferase RlmD [Flavobacteriales bacterium]|nr:23S rRNA (uracil(1939)-C(5))-methyltransferase RlmD [Bacteroidota bacterium]